MWDLVGRLPDVVIGAIIGTVGFIALLTSISNLVGGKGGDTHTAEATIRQDLMARLREQEAKSRTLHRQNTKLINLVERAARKCPGECADFLDAELQAFFNAEDVRG